MTLTLVLMGSIMAGALAAFLKANPPVKIFFRRRFGEMERWPWWYGMLPLSHASKVTGVLIPFHILYGWYWRFRMWFQFLVVGYYPKEVVAKIGELQKEIRDLHELMGSQVVDAYIEGEKAGKKQRRGAG